ncbi:MAG: Ig-like domain-containing protein [Bacteroidales bacterium]
MPAYADGTINIAAPANGDGWTFSGNVVTITADGNYTVTGTSNANRVLFNKNVTATVTLQNAHIHSDVASPFMLSSDTIAGGKGSQVTLILSGTNELVTTERNSAGLIVEDSAKLTIEGDGSLIAQGGDDYPRSGGGAGIGGSSEHNGGYITITGGTVTAIGGVLAAGIGGGAVAGGGNITITGGTVTATGGYCSAGIGGGYYGDGGNVTITGGAVNATGGVTGAGIGGGRNGNGGNITIKNGTVIAIAPAGGNGDAAAIGGGAVYGGAGTINITGGTVYASSGAGTGIGGTWRDISGTVNITGGTVMANKIGNGFDGIYLVPTISGSNTVVLSQTITATTFGGATVLTGSNVSVSDSITIGDNVADVTLNAALTIPGGATFVVPAGFVFDVNNKALTNNGIIREYGSLLNKGSLTGAQPVGAIQAGWISIPAQTYTGDSIKPTISVTNGTLTLAHGAHYTITAYANNVNAGTATVTLTDLGDYSIVSKTFTIAPKTLADGWIQDIPAQTYTGDSIEPALTVRDGSNILTLNTDYTVAYTNNLNQGTATATVTGIGNYTGSAGKTFLIEDNTPPAPVQIAAGWIQDIPAQTYTGDSIEPAVVVKDGSKNLTLNTDYTVAYSNNVNAGTATVTVTGMGNYTGSAGKTFLIEDNTQPAPVQIADGWIQDIPAQTYTGDSIKPALTVRDGSNILTLNTDYTVACTNNVDVGTATVTVIGIGNYTGTASKAFTINPKQFTDDRIESIPAQTYTGSAIEPALTVRDGSAVLTAGRDYDVVYDNNVNVGTASVTVIGTGNYTGTASKAFTIYPKPVAGAIQVQNIPAQTYTGEQIKPAITVTDGSLTLTQGVHYTYTCMDNVDAGTAMITVTGVGNYTGTTNKSFSINPKTVADNWIEDIPAQTYTGEQIKPAITVTDGSAVLTPGRDYTVAYDNNMNVGKNSITVTGTGNYTGTANQSFTINPKPVAGDWIEDIPDRTYTGEQIKPAITVTDGSAVLTAGRDYTVAYNNNMNVGTATVMVAGTGNYTGTASKSFAIYPKPIAGNWIENFSNQTYTGEQLWPAVTVRDGSALLVAGRDYTVTYDDNVNVGTATVTVTGMGNYTEGGVKTFTIYPKQIAFDCIEDIPDRIYTGGAIEPAVIMVRDGSVVLTDGVHYTATCINNVNAGMATVVVTGNGNYSGVAYKYFFINPKPVADYWIENIPDRTYTGAPLLPAVTVRDGYNILTAGIHYIVTYLNNVEAGTAIVTITGVGNYTGTAMGTFNIVRSKITIKVSWVQVIPDQFCTGYPLKPAVTVAGLTQNVDYTVSFYNNIYAGTGVALITGIGNYTGEVTKSFRIIDTGTEEAANTVLRIVSEDNGTFFFSGLTPGKAFSIYTLQGQPVYESKATSPEAHIYLQDKGIYILKHQNKSYKFNR